MDYCSAPGAGLKKIIPEVRMPPGDGDEKRRYLAVQAAEKSDYAKMYQAASSPEDRVELMRQARAKENQLREKFAQDRDSQDLSDPYVNLLPVHLCDKRYNMFQCRDLSSEEQATPKVFPLASRRTGAAITDSVEFKDNFDVFTEGLLRNLNWDNVFAAGGSVLASLLPLPENRRNTKQGRRKYFHHESYTVSDIDLFFYGLDEEQASQKLQEVYFTICDTLPDPNVQPICFRTRHAVTIVSKFPYRHVQVILRLYKSPSEVLAGFDVDSCSVGYDGVNVWMTPRCHNSVVAQYNSVDVTRRSPTYEVRLMKYAARGLEVAVPGLDRERLDPQLFETPSEKARGLKKLLLLEKLQTPEDRQKYKLQQRVGRLQPVFVRQGRFYNRLQQDMSDSFIQSQIEQAGGDVSDYQTVFLPWGPEWDADKVRNLMYTKDMLLNSAFVDPLRKTFRHPCFFGTASEILLDCSPEAKEGKVEHDEEAEEEDDERFVRGPLTWLAVDPGQQTVGSFHPITMGDWRDGVHLSGSTQRLVEISQQMGLTDEQAKLALEAIEPPVDSGTVNSKDAAGRTPVMLAALTGNAAAIKAFIGAGALLNSRLTDGRTALHLAAQYGKANVLPSLLEQGEKLNEKLGAHLKKLEEEERGLAKMQIEEDKKLKDLWETEGAGAYFRSLHALKRKRARDAAKQSALLEEKGFLDRLDLDGEDYDQKMTPLMYATFFGHVDVVEALLNARADVSKVLTYENNGVPCQKQALTTLACHNGHADVLGLILSKRADVGQMDMQKFSALHYAASLGEADCVKILLQHQALNSVNANVEAPLILAVRQGHVEVVELLLASMKVVAAISSKSDKKPVQVALESMHPDVLSSLLRSGADPNVLFSPNDGAFGRSFQNQGMFGQPAFGGFGMFGGFGGRGPSKKQRDPDSTPLDYVESQLKALDVADKASSDSKEPEETLQPHVSMLEYFDFLLSRTTGTFETFALKELKRREEEAVAERQKSSKPMKFPPVQSNDEKRAKLESMMAVLREFGAKRRSDLPQEIVDKPQGSKKSKAKKSPSRTRRTAQVNAKVAEESETSLGPQSKGAFQLGVEQTNSPAVSFTEKFTALKVPTTKFASMDKSVSTVKMQPQYKLLFDAVARCDCNEVRRLCAIKTQQSDAEVTEPLIVAVYSTMLRASPLGIAVLLDDPDMVRLLLQIASEQYVRESDPDESEESEQVAVRHTDLVQLGAQNLSFAQIMERKENDVDLLKEQQAFKRKGQKMLDRLEQYKAEALEEEEKDADIEEETVDGPTEVTSWSVCSEFNYVVGANVVANALHLGVRRRRFQAVRALLEEIQKLDVVVEEKPSQGFGHVSQDDLPPSLKSTLLATRENIKVGVLGNVNATPFETAIAIDDVQMAELLLEFGASDCLRGENQETPFVYSGLAVDGETREDLSLPRKLVVSRAQLKSEQLRALHLATASSSEKCLDFLLDGGLDAFAMVNDTVDGAEQEVLSSLFSLKDVGPRGDTALRFAVVNDLTEVVKQLLDLGQRVMKRDDFLRLLNDTTHPSDSRKRVMPPLYDAVSHGKVHCAKLLLDAGALVVAPGLKTMSLHYGVRLPELNQENKEVKQQMLDLLIDASQSVEGGLRNVLEKADKTGLTALHISAQLQSQLASEVLLKSIAGLEAEDRRAVLEMRTPSGESPLHLAAQHKGPHRVEAVQALIDAGADAGALDGSSASPLHLAAKTQAPMEVLKLLVPSGDDGGVGVEDAVGRTPLEWALASKLQEITKLSDPFACQARTQDGQAVKLLAQAENAGRRVVDPAAVLAHAALQTKAAIVKQPQPMFQQKVASSSGDDD